MVVRENSVLVRFTPQEAKRLSEALMFALSFLQEFALEQNRREFETLMSFIGRLDVAIDAAATLQHEEDGP